MSALLLAISEKNREECIRAILEETEAAKGSAANEDKRSFDCAAAEVGAGVVAVLGMENGEDGGTGGSEREKQEGCLWDAVLPFIETELEGVSLEGRLDW